MTIKQLLRPLRGVAKGLEKAADAITDHRIFGDRDSWRIGIRAYATYGTSRQVRFRGRVLRDHALSKPSVDDRWYKNLHRAFHALESDEVPGATVELTFRDNRRTVRSDEEGYINEVFEIDGEPLNPGWHDVHAKILDVPFGKVDSRQFSSACLIPNPEARFGIISDIDDTVLQSSVTRPWAMFKLLLLGNWEKRLAVEGTPDLYQSLTAGPHGTDDNPTFYVSSSPWNLEPMLTAFINRVGLPRGPLMLRDLGIGEDADLGLSHGHKEVKINQILETYPDMKFVLLGDAGQEDAAIYARVCEAHGDQVEVAYIRQVDSMPSDRVVQAVAHASDRGTPIYLLPGTKSIAADAEKRGLIRSADAGDPVDDTTTNPTLPAGGDSSLTDPTSPMVAAEKPVPV